MALVRRTDELPIVVLELDRKEKKNALNIALRDELEQVLVQLEEDDRVKGVVLTGGPDFFSAGFDLKELVDTDLKAVMHRGVEFAERTSFFKKPLVTSVAGFAFAGGFDLALCGDVIVAAHGAKLGRPEVRWGINPLISKLWLRVGMPRAIQMSLSGETVLSQDGLGFGLVDRVVPPGELMATARHEALRLTTAPLEAILAVKRAARAVPALDPHAGLDLEFRLSAEILAGSTVRDTLRAYARSVGVLK